MKIQEVMAGIENAQGSEGMGIQWKRRVTDFAAAVADDW